MKRVGLGIIGCGMISEIYLKNLCGRFSDAVEVRAISDIRPERASARASQFGISRISDVDAMLAAEDIEIVLVLTLPSTHFGLCRQALEAGKHVYVEKPLSLTYEQGKELHLLAQQKGLLLGGAPDTFLGAGLATSAAVVRRGTIGTPVAATALMMSHGWETGHEHPDFYYLAGGGPMFDMGPYYITALVSILGNARQVCAMGGRAHDTRTILCGPRLGEHIPVEVDTHIAGNIRFDNGCIASVITTFDVWETGMPFLQIFGTEGTLIVPDPNYFNGPVLMLSPDGSMREIPLENAYTENCRGLGVFDMAEALRTGGIMQASSTLTLHVLEILEAFHQSGDAGRFISLKSSGTA